MARKTKSTEQLRAEIDAQKAALADMRRALKAREREEQKAAAAARAEADRALADRMLAKLRSELADATDDELTLVFERMLAARMHDQPRCTVPARTGACGALGRSRVGARMRVGSPRGGEGRSPSP